MIQAWATAFFLGLLGSLHCIGMCGPLVLALPTQHLNATRRVTAALLYHGGRILVYSLGGMIFGLLGHRVWLAGWQQGFSITLGVLILLLVAFRRFLPATTGAYAPVQRIIARLWQGPSISKFFLLGMANGLLPCGMVYLAIAGALTRPQVIEAVGFMAFFGLGTLPLLLLLQYTGHRLGLPFRLQLRRALPYITILMAILLILRGLDLGIPFVSPALPAAPGQSASCH